MNTLTLSTFNPQNTKFLCKIALVLKGPTTPGHAEYNMIETGFRELNEDEFDEYVVISSDDNIPFIVMKDYKDLYLQLTNG